MIVLHGGRSESRDPVSPRQLSVVRMAPFAARLRREGGPHGLAVWRPRYRIRGWNGAEASPLADITGVLDQARREHPGVPVALVGYSMGGRVALRLARRPEVTTVAALAPWVTDQENASDLAGRHVLFLHGTQDRTTDPRRTVALAERAGPQAASCGMVLVRGSGHSMLRRAGLWHELTAGFVLSGLDMAPPPPAVAEVLAHGGTPVEL